MENNVNNEVVNNDLNLEGKKILLVDDNKLNIKVAQRLIQKYNPEVEAIESGFECLDKIKNGNKYDLILMDDMMPEMSGTETQKRLRQIYEYDFPIIVLTANAIEGAREKYLEEGFDEYISKPIIRNELERILKMFLLEKNNAI